MSALGQKQKCPLWVISRHMRCKKVWLYTAPATSHGYLSRAERMNNFWEALVDFQYQDVIVVALCANGER